jgi:hypothetical protein
MKKYTILLKISFTFFFIIALFSFFPVSILAQEADLPAPTQEQPSDQPVLPLTAELYKRVNGWRNRRSRDWRHTSMAF